MAAAGSPCRTCPYLRMALPLAAQGRISGREGRHTLSIRIGAVHRRRDVPAVRPDNMSGTDVARYLHAGDEAAHCRRDPGGWRPYRVDATCAQGTKPFTILRRITMANPTWFDETFYLNDKLAQLKAVDPKGKLNDGKAWSSVDDVKAALKAAGYEGDEGLYQHFVDFGMDENISPNEAFDATFYLRSKAAALNAINYEGKVWTAASVMDAFKAAGIESAWEHYQMFGSSEGIATSTVFDSEAYFVAKVNQLNSTAYEGRSNWTVDEVKAAFAEQGLTALEHYQLYGEDEKIADYAGDDGFKAEAPKAEDGGLGLYTGVTTYATLEAALAAQANGTLAENYAITNSADAGEVTVAQQAGIAGLLAGATPAITAKPSYTLVDTVDAISNVNTLVMQGSDGYEIKDTLANITAAADSTVVMSAEAVTVTDLGDDGITVTKINNYVAGSDTGFVSAASDLTKPWATDSNDLLVATNDKAIDFGTLKGLDWDDATHFVTAMKGAANILEGGKGDDTLVGKDGVMDVFLFNSWTLDGVENNTCGGKLLGNDTIYNFEIGTDKLLINDPYAEAGKGMINGSSNVSFGEEGGNATITIAGGFFHDGLGASADVLTITLMGVTRAEAEKAGDDLFAFAPAE